MHKLIQKQIRLCEVVEDVAIVNTKTTQVSNDVKVMSRKSRIFNYYDQVLYVEKLKEVERYEN